MFMDDVLVHGKAIDDHDKILDTVRSKMASAGLTLNLDKRSFRKSSVKYLGHIISGEGITPDTAKVNAIVKLPEPTNVTELRRALGMFTYLARFLPKYSTVSAPLRLLLRSDSAWCWDGEQQKAFSDLKQLAVTAPCLKHYNPALPSLVSADASSYGIGGELMQKHGNEWMPVAYASRSLTDTEKGYAQIEKECLAAVWTCERFDQYLFGAPRVLLQTDHKPLVPLINTRDLDKVPLRCQRLLLRFLRYEVEAVHVPGKDMTVADTLSRAPTVGAVNEPTSILSAEIEESIGAIAADLGLADKLQSIATSTADDSDLQKVLHYVQHRWPTPVPDAIKAYQQEHHHLSSEDGVIFHGRRIVVPSDMRASIMEKLHEGHQGITKTRAHAQVYCWWPGISNDITTYVTGCETCTKRRYQPPEALSPTDFPERPWQRLASDICKVKGTHYLVTIDYFSRFIDVERLPSLTSAAVVNCLTSLFAVHGYPECLVSDNGLQFSCDSFRQFLTSGTITHRTSSPRHL